MQVKVTFFMQGDDPDHEMGVTNDTYEDVVDILQDEFGADDIRFEKVVDVKVRRLKEDLP